MRVEFINPFVSGLATTFGTMLDCEIQRGEISLNTNKYPSHEISGVIGMSGLAIGTTIISLSKPVALQAASTMLMSPCEEIDQDVTDAVGELANMVAGSAKAQLEEYQMSISLPNVMLGKDAKLVFPSNVQPITIPFNCKWGDLSLEVGLSVVKTPVNLA